MMTPEPPPAIRRPRSQRVVGLIKTRKPLGSGARSFSNAPVNTPSGIGDGSDPL